MAIPDFFEDFQKEKIAAFERCRSQVEINEAVLNAFCDLSGQYFNRLTEENHALRRRLAKLEKIAWRGDAV